MLYQINYKYVHANGNVRSGCIAIEAKDNKDAATKAAADLKTEFDHYSITAIKPWGTPQT